MATQSFSQFCVKLLLVKETFDQPALPSKRSPSSGYVLTKHHYIQDPEVSQLYFSHRSGTWHLFYLAEDQDLQLSDTTSCGIRQAVRQACCVLLQHDVSAVSLGEEIVARRPAHYTVSAA